MIPNRLRGDRVIVELEPVQKSQEDKDSYKETASGILMAKQETEKKADAVELRKGTVIRVGHLIHERDLKEGMTVYVKPFQGDRLVSDKEYFLFRETNVIGND